jgi:hypothetical protein
MNERIRELAIKAGRTGLPYGEVEIQKFAELIIQECISALDEKIYRSIDGDGDEIWTDLILKEHFGVEK